MLSGFADTDRPIRVLHVLKQMTLGGVESWLLHALRHTDRARLHMDIAVRGYVQPELRQAFTDLGAGIYSIARPQWRWTYAAPFRNILIEHGPYDIVHCHSLFNRGYILRLAKLNGVPVRIAHSHNAPNTDTGWIRGFRVALRNHRLSHMYTNGLACSRLAAKELFGTEWRNNPRVRLLYCGVDLEPFRAAPDPTIRAELGIPPGASVVGHVGRFDSQKNHAFLVDIARETIARDPAIVFLLVGTGDLHPVIEARVRDAGLADHFVFAGQRSDVPRLLRGAMDAFLLPSFHEGLPLVGMEAQAAGLPMIISSAITDEMDAVPALIRRLSLGLPPSEWAEGLLRHMRNGPAVAQADALAAMECGPFNIRNSVAALQALYEESIGVSYPS